MIAAIAERVDDWISGGMSWMRELDGDVVESPEQAEPDGYGDCKRIERTR